jgi:hypothetical protein
LLAHIQFPAVEGSIEGIVRERLRPDLPDPQQPPQELLPVFVLEKGTERGIDRILILLHPAGL